VWNCRGNDQLRRFAVSRLVRTLLLAAVTFCLVAPTAGAAAARPLLGDLWTTLLEAPTTENPFGTGDPACLELRGNTVAPFTASPQDFTCSVKRGTKILVAASTWECSTFAGDHFDFGTTEAELRACARAHDAPSAPTVTVDGRPVRVSAVETGLLTISLPEDNIFGLSGADRQGRSVAHGWVVRLKQLAPGTHTIELDIAGNLTTTTIAVN
jgi:hypothetical protein